MCECLNQIVDDIRSLDQEYPVLKQGKSHEITIIPHILVFAINTKGRRGKKVLVIKGTSKQVGYCPYCGDSIINQKFIYKPT